MQDLPEELWHESFRYYVKEDKTRRGGPNMRMIRLDPNKPSLTVTGYIFNKFVHPFENRFVTVREAARLQGFPDFVEFKGSLTSTQQQVGNAVPVELSKAIFKAVLESEIFKNAPDISGLSLFSGAGGMDLGAFFASQELKSSFETKVAVDVWDDACETLRATYENLHPMTVVNESISDIDYPTNFWKEHSKVEKTPDIIYGGPPCQAFSQAGKQKGISDPRGQLIDEFLRFVEVLSPKAFIMENVANLKGIAKGKLYEEIVESMESLGYNVTVEVLLAADYGSPQLRKRIIFIGTKKDLPLIKMPSKTHSSEPSLFEIPYTTVEQAFRELPKLC